MNIVRLTLTGLFYKKFKIIWICGTALIYLLCSYFNWQNNIINTRNAIIETAYNLAYNVNNFIDNIYFDINLPTYNKNLSINCEKNFYPYLHHIILNHPQISGIAILDTERHVICSTLPNNKSFFVKDSESFSSITGPLKIDMFDNPIFSFKRKVNTYVIEVIITSPILQTVLHTKPTLKGVQSISLISTNTHKRLLAIEPRDEENSLEESNWLSNIIYKMGFISTPETIFASANLKSVSGAAINITHCSQILLNNLWLSQFLLLIDLLILSYFSYILVRNTLENHSSLQWAIRNAVKNDRFYPVYQPLYNTELNRYSGVEVLLRWKSNANEVIMPDLFIKEAESTGLIIPISLKIIETTFLDMKRIISNDPLFHLSFNLCALHFVDNDFFESFYRLISKFKVAPQQIILEITERELLDQNNILYLKRMQELRSKGFSLAIDDYGTGHASINYLQSFPFNYLKIDKLFIQAIGTKAITESLNDAIIDLAKRIDLIIIAEGVETKEQVDYLLTNGIQLLQGWYFSKELSIEKLNFLLQGGTK